MIKRFQTQLTRKIALWLRLGASLVLALFLTACSDSSGTLALSPIGANTQALELTMPRFLQNRTVNPDDLIARVTINGERFNPTRLADTSVFRGTTQVPEGEAVELRVEWIELVSGQNAVTQELLLAILEEDFPRINSNVEVSFLEDDYETQDFRTYPRLDLDNDNVPNFSERVENSSPFDSFDPVARANAFVPFVNTTNFPVVIDGRFDDVWRRAQYQDRNGNNLFIDNRMVGFDPIRPDQNTEFRWGAMHDGQYLYILVFGEIGMNRTTQGDSVQPWMDDAIDIFWDGNRSQGRTYDGVDDYHMIIPLTQLNSIADNSSHLADGTLNPNGRGEPGFNSADIVDFEGVSFATCVACDQHVYEVRLDLDVLGIPLDRSMGFDVQINNDVDGGERDFKFGWEAPSAPDNIAERDNTWRDPSQMGLLELVSAENSTAIFIE